MRGKIIVAAMLFAVSAHAQTPAQLTALADTIRPVLIEAYPSIGTDGVTDSIFIGRRAGWNGTFGTGNIFIGICAGATSFLFGDNNILVGAYTSVPSATISGFVNLGNALCFWRDTGERVDCPPPEPGCK